LVGDVGAKKGDQVVAGRYVPPLCGLSQNIVFAAAQAQMQLLQMVRY
jgi:hypothetical protein